MSYRELWSLLAQHTGQGEAQAIARMVFDVAFGLSLADILSGKDTQLSADDQKRLEEIARRLEKQEPVQYVLGTAEFGGRRFRVTPATLIPRPETYELCQWVLQERDTPCADSRCPERAEGAEEAEGALGQRILDIGTGSGCIACTLALEMPSATVTAWDISAEALDVARDNARQLRAGVTFEQADALHIPRTSSHPRSSFLVPRSSNYDIIVSNPPYICRSEAEQMSTNVLDYEPHTALFVPDDDPLLFYRAIADYGRQTLSSGGALYFEINPLYAAPLASLLTAMSFHSIEQRADQFGKTRFTKAVQP